ncbi:hypothetical protein CHS0354_021910 [Potamilus streckersoni]|uniref:TIR domain-containing protein n=1 Tax=Potamilus streckersoni TaxID=2493646 RepID=A0AAE0SJW0_9BIVA|nr:hypothetical protein CHS0354_021910 [Potamilus streckersoni]
MKGTSSKKAAKTEMMRLGRRVMVRNKNSKIQGNETSRSRQLSTIKEERMKIFPNATDDTVPANLMTTTIVQKCTSSVQFRRSSYASNGQIATTCKEHVTQSTTSIETIVNNQRVSFPPISTIQQKLMSSSDNEAARRIDHLHCRKQDLIDSVLRRFSVNKQKNETRKDWKKFPQTKTYTSNDRSIRHLLDEFGRKNRASNSTGNKVIQSNPADDPDLSLHIPSGSRTKHVAKTSIAEAPPLPRGKRYHVFFSYRHCENEIEWVQRIIKRLESSHLNYKCCFDDRDFMAGESIVDNIEKAIQASLRVAVVLTPEYMKSVWCQHEATVMRVPGCKANIIPLVLKKVQQIPNSLNGLTYITVTRDSDQWWECFLKALKRNIPSLPASNSEHIFVFHDEASEEDMKRVETLLAALESSESSFRCISSGENFVCGKSIWDNLHECAEKAVITVFALSSKFPKEKWLKHWQDLDRNGIKLFPLKFDKFDLPEELKT